jgi:hypothetical protein
MPGWAALCADGIRELQLPPEAVDIVIGADNDGNGVGLRAAEDAAERFVREARRVQIMLPPRPQGVDKVDFNDVLLGAIHG